MHLFFSIRGVKTAPANVVVIQLDDESKKELGIRISDAIPRAFYVEAIAKLIPQRPKAIILDIFFESAGPDEKADKDLSEILARTPSVIAARFFSEIESKVPRNKENIRQNNRGGIFPLFARSAKWLIPMRLPMTSNIVENISHRDVVDSEKVPLVWPLRDLVEPEIEHPGKYDLINYYGDPIPIAGIPFSSLFSKKNPMPENIFTDKIVMFGWANRRNNGITQNRNDTFLTPASGNLMYGVEIHATIVANLLDRSWIRRWEPWKEGFLLFGLSLCIAFAAVSVSLRQGVLLLIASCGFGLIFSYIAFAHFLFFFPAMTLFGITMPVFTLLLASFASFREHRKRRELATALGAKID